MLRRLIQPRFFGSFHNQAYHLAHKYSIRAQYRCFSSKKSDDPLDQVMSDFFASLDASASKLPSDASSSTQTSAEKQHTKEIVHLLGQFLPRDHGNAGDAASTSPSSYVLDASLIHATDATRQLSRQLIHAKSVVDLHDALSKFMTLYFPDPPFFHPQVDTTDDNAPTNSKNDKIQNARQYELTTTPKLLSSAIARCRKLNLYESACVLLQSIRMRGTKQYVAWFDEDVYNEWILLEWDHAMRKNYSVNKNSEEDNEEVDEEEAIRKVQDLHFSAKLSSQVALAKLKVVIWDMAENGISTNVYTVGILERMKDDLMRIFQKHVKRHVLVDPHILLGQKGGDFSLGYRDDQLWQQTKQRWNDLISTLHNCPESLLIE